MKRVPPNAKKSGARVREALGEKLDKGYLDSTAKKAQEYGHRKPYSGTQYWIQMEHENHIYCPDSDDSDNDV